MRLTSLCLLLTIPLVQSAVVPDSRFVVTDLRVVEGPTRLAALDVCQRDIPGGLSVGVDWGNGPTGSLVHLCEVRTRIDELKDGASVLRRIVVLSDTACPAGMQLLVSPRSGVIVCTEYASYSSGLVDAGDYIEDLAVTKERNYNNDAPGWTTVPYSLHTSSFVSNTVFDGVFVSYRKPVRAVTELCVLNRAVANDVASACTKTFGIAWRTSGEIGYLDQPDKTTKTVLCMKRERGSATIKHLVDIMVVDATTDCPMGFQTRLILSSTLSLCSKWRGGVSDFIADLELHRVNPVLDEGSDPTEPEFLPGSFKLVTTRNLNTDSEPVYLFTRKWERTKTSTLTALERSLRGPHAKSPLTATVDASGASLSFKILQIADLHYTGDPTFPCKDVPDDMINCTETWTTTWVNDLLDIEKPDFVAFTGDNVNTFTADRHHLAMDVVVGGVEARQIPYGIVLGNHDDDNGFSREEIMRIAMSKPFSYAQRGPRHVDGVGNYELGVQAPVDGPWGAKGTDVFRMYFLDSHGAPDTTKYPCINSRYDWVKSNQIEYYRHLSELHAAHHNRVPAVMFFHIPLVEYAANAPSKTNGQQEEKIGASSVSTNLFSTLVDMEEVKATFVGHDHVNEFCYKRQGIQLCYGGGVGYGQAYSHGTFLRRARAIEWTMNSKGERTIRSWKRRFGELATKWLEETLYTEEAL